MNNDKEKQIITSWHENSTPWINAIENQEIESRVLCTNQAIIQHILELKPASILDIGCGEGWLCRALEKYNIQTTGIDASETLIKKASSLGKGQFYLSSYDNIETTLKSRQFDLVVCNFSLLGKDSVDNLFKTIPSLLSFQGHCVIQTLHPLFAIESHSYFDSWQHGSWQGFNKNFSNPAPWYFRTMSSWFNLFTDNNFIISGVHEPINPVTGFPASIIVCGVIRE